MRRVVATIAVSFVVLFVLLGFSVHDEKSLDESDTNTQQRSPFGHFRPALLRHDVTSSRSVYTRLWPDKSRPYDDRIVQQMRFVPDNYIKRSTALKALPDQAEKWTNAKIIFAPAGFGNTPEGQEKFLEDECPVHACVLTSEPQYQRRADVILLQNDFLLHQEKLPHQVFMLWMLESPIHTGSLGVVRDQINWTASYRSDSTIVTPYEKFVHFANYTSLPAQADRNYALGKTKKVAWFVSNCNAANQRMEYAKELSRYINVDIYGACGDLSCPRFKQQDCNDMLGQKYKFYLAFENSNCIHYITEKFYWNALL